MIASIITGVLGACALVAVLSEVFPARPEDVVDLRTVL